MFLGWSIKSRIVESIIANYCQISLYSYIILHDYQQYIRGPFSFQFANSFGKVIKLLDFGKFRNCKVIYQYILICVSCTILTYISCIFCFMKSVAIKATWQVLVFNTHYTMFFFFPFNNFWSEFYNIGYQDC